MHGLSVWVFVLLGLTVGGCALTVYAACVLSSRISRATRGLYGDDE